MSTLPWLDNNREDLTILVIRPEMISLLQVIINLSRLEWIEDSITVNTARYMVIVSKGVIRYMGTHQATDFTTEEQSLQQLFRLIYLVTPLKLLLHKPIHHLIANSILPVRLLFRDLQQNNMLN